MANHQSAKKSIRQSGEKKVSNKYYAKTTRNAIKKIRSSSEKASAVEILPKVASMLDKMAKRGQIHKNKASNIKSSLAKHVQSL